ncbi:MAG: ABC transporter permease [Bacteroidaceae bacterium]|nr:ABC transporter permease [Bacteroidaceae bacterium]
MKYELFISRRYLFSKKSHNAINIVSLIAVAGVAVATLAMVVVMSVFNGFQGLVSELFTGFDPEIRVTPVHGTTIDMGSDKVSALTELPDVAVLTPVVEGQALVMTGELQKVVMLKGVSDNFMQQSNVRDIFYGDAEPILHLDVLEYCIPGIQLCNELGLPLYFRQPLQVYAPKKGERVNMANPRSSFNRDELNASGLVFGVHQAKYDSEYILCSISFAQRLFELEGQATALEIKLADDGRRENITALLGNGFRVQDRHEQQEDVFRIMQIEKLLSYAFLCFILFVACLNIMGSLSMLMIEKRDNMRTLSALGSTAGQIRRIFAFEGMMIIFGGAAVGMLLAIVLCLLQQHFGFIRMGQNDGSFIIDAYPVRVAAMDLLTIMFTVLLLGGASVWWTTRRAGIGR